MNVFMNISTKKNIFCQKNPFWGSFTLNWRYEGVQNEIFIFFSKTHTSRLHSRTEPKFEKFTLCWRRPIIECFYEYFNNKEHLLPENSFLGEFYTKLRVHEIFIFFRKHILDACRVRQNQNLKNSHFVEEGQ